MFGKKTIKSLKWWLKLTEEQRDNALERERVLMNDKCALAAENAKLLRTIKELRNDLTESRDSIERFKAWVVQCSESEDKLIHEKKLLETRIEGYTGRIRSLESVVEELKDALKGVQEKEQERFRKLFVEGVGEIGRNFTIVDNAIQELNLGPIAQFIVGNYFNLGKSKKEVINLLRTNFWFKPEDYEEEFGDDTPNVWNWTEQGWVPCYGQIEKIVNSVINHFKNHI